MMNKFRETLWFKKGLLDADLAHEAHRSGDGLATGAVDLLPVEDRYADDGSVSSADSAALSLRTGVTRKLEVIKGAPGKISSVSTLARDAKRGRGKLLAMLGASAAALALAVTLYAI
jgi:hypothetical protein